jgi:hypothetical protein
LSGRGTSHVRLLEINGASPLVSELSPAIQKWKKYKSPGIDLIPAELIHARGETFISEIRNVMNSVWNKEELAEQPKKSIIVPIYTNGHKNY